MSVVKKTEFNAEGRARQGERKIKTKDKYDGVSPGKLLFSVSYNFGSLHVNIDAAKELFGRRSQDPYALVYLLAGDGSTYFQDGNEKTVTFDKTLDPPFKTKFEFKMALEELNKLSLVVAIWDSDSTSRDDYIAGVRLSMKEVQYFQKKELVWISLQAQLLDGHPGELNVKDVFGVVYHVGSWDLKTCNNHLVNFIEKARVLAEAMEVKKMYPDRLTETTNSMPPNAGMLFDEEIARLRAAMQRSRARMEDRRRERDVLQSENSGLMRRYMSSVAQLSQTRTVMAGLELRESELRSKMVGLDYLRIKIEELERRIREDQPRPSSWHERRILETMTKVNWDFGIDAINIGKSSVDQRTLDLIIKIQTEYLAKMKRKLEEVRRTYSLRYDEFILTVEKSAAEIMRLYEDIIRERSSKGPDYMNALLELEVKRDYGRREQTLRWDIEQLLARIASIGRDFYPIKEEIGRVGAELEALKVRLRELLKKMIDFAQSRYDVTNEISIYDNLIGFEEKRLASIGSQHRVSVKTSTVRRSHTADFGLSSHGSMSSSGYRRESGYSSPANTPTGTTERTLTSFEFRESGESVSVRRASQRSSTSSSVVNGRGSKFLDELKPEIL